MVKGQGGVGDRKMSSKGHGGVRQRAGVKRTGFASDGPLVAAVRRREVSMTPLGVL